jgi:hypothetical protein
MIPMAQSAKSIKKDKVIQRRNSMPYAPSLLAEGRRFAIQALTPIPIN